MRDTAEQSQRIDGQRLVGIVEKHCPGGNVRGTPPKIAKKHQRTMTDLLGRLEEKYDVGLTIPGFDIDYFFFDIALGEKGHQVPLDEWGSGTRNRTRILFTLFQAKRLIETKGSDSKTTPIIVIEEPESFLHPSAQAEFGRVLQDLSEEFGVQILATTHSPYMLNQGNPSSNILLRRRIERNHIRETEKVSTEGEAASRNDFQDF